MQWLSSLPPAVWIAVLALGALTALVCCVYLLPQILVPGRSAESLKDVIDPAKKLELEDARLKERNDVRATLLQGLAGAFVALGLSLTWRQIRVNQEGQITERFNKAIDHLGSDKLELRLGGIYALERIANNSKADRGTIAEVLTAFVRQRSPWPPLLPGQYPANVPVDKQPTLRTRAADIQTAMTVLGRGGFTREGAMKLDLASVDLRRAHLAGAHLERADLRGAHLEGANLSSAHLEHANLRGAHLEYADLLSVHLDRADFRGAHLEHANLLSARLGRADFRSAKLEGADFYLANQDHAKFGEMKWEETLLEEGLGETLEERLLASPSVVDGPNGHDDTPEAGSGA
jgi:hypothetical protein